MVPLNLPSTSRSSKQSGRSGFPNKSCMHISSPAFRPHVTPIWSTLIRSPQYLTTSKSLEGRRYALGVGKDMEGSGRGLFEVVSWYVGGENAENHEKPWGSRCPAPDSDRYKNDCSPAPPGISAQTHTHTHTNWRSYSPIVVGNL